MLKNTKGKWVQSLEISEELWQQLMQETLNGVIELLESTKTLLEHSGNEAICAGLYSFAVEEYGKLQLLQKYEPSGKKVKIKYKHEFRNHNKKFEIAIRNLPPRCVNLGRLGFSEGYENGFESKKTIADFEARLAIFYSDFLESGDKIKPVPFVDKQRLKIAVDEFLMIALGN